MRKLHLFAGAGGGALADAITGDTPAAFCEIDPFSRRVLDLRWPGVPTYPDVTTLCGLDVLMDAGPIDCVSGGSPCQDVSTAGVGAGFFEGARSSLIWHQVRLLEETGARRLEWENVAGTLSKKHRPAFDAFLLALECLGFGGAWCVLSAEQVGAPHERKRLWLVAEKGVSGFHRLDTRELTGGVSVPWPTLTANGNNNRPYPGKKSSDGLAYALKRDAAVRVLYATLLAHDAQDTVCPGNLIRRSPSVAVSVVADAVFPGRDFRELAMSLTACEIAGVVGDLRINPDWAEAFMGLPIGHTDLGNLAPAAAPGWPAFRFQEQHEWEPSRLVRRFASPDWRQRIIRLGNAQVPVQAATAYQLLDIFISFLPRK